MTRQPIISVSGLRGVVGETLTAEIAQRYVEAYLVTLGGGSIIVTRDGRASGPELAKALHQTITAAGRDCLDADVAATPTTGVLVREHSAAGGIQISASHNPPEYNGLKLFGPDGRILTAEAGGEVLSNYRRSISAKTADRPGDLRSVEDTISAHWYRIRATVAVDAIRQRGFRVVLDANHGAGSVLGRHLLEQLGCQITLLGGEPDGRFDHPPEPTAENLSGVLETVSAARATVGFCQDPDADRLALVDENGVYLGEEYTLAICVQHLLSQKHGPIVTNCSTSRMSEDIATKHAVPFARSAVGEAHVASAMIEHGAILGGEGNGGVIDPRVGFVRDSFVGMAVVLDALAVREIPVSELAAELPRYEIHKTKIPLDRDKLEPALTALERTFADATADHLDGLRLDWPHQWLLVRASNTEPIVRAIAEAPSAAMAQELCARAADVLTSV